MICVVFVQMGSAQRIIKTSGDKDIRINEDGSWEYVEKVIDTLDSLTIMDGVNTDTDPFEVPTDSQSDNTQNSLSQQQELYEKILDAEHFFDEEIKRAKDNHKLLKKERKRFLKGKLKDTLITLEEIEAEILLVEDRKRDLELRHQIIKEYIKEIVKTDKVLSETEIISLEKRYEELMEDKPIEQSQAIAFTTIEEPVEEDSYSFLIYPSNTFKDPPQTPCKIIEREVSDGSNKTRIDSKPEYLFGYTHDKLKSYFRDQDFMVCNAQLSQYGAYYFVTLHFEIKSKKAKTNYGYIERNSPIRFQLINGERIYARNTRNSHGTLQEHTGNTEYSATFMIEEPDLKVLAKNELDNVGILWTSGFEDYEIFQVDFFMEQAKCFKL